jgi:hypothetical protein
VEQSRLAPVRSKRVVRGIWTRAAADISRLVERLSVAASYAGPFLRLSPVTELRNGKEVGSRLQLCQACGWGPTGNGRVGDESLVMPLYA